MKMVSCLTHHFFINKNIIIILVMIKTFDKFINEGFTEDSLLSLDIAFKMLSMRGNLICFIGDEKNMIKFIDALLEERKDKLDEMKDGIYTCGIDMTKYGFKEIDRDKLLQIKSNGKNKAAILINSDMKNDNNVKEILLKANIKLDLNQFEIE